MLTNKSVDEQMTLVQKVDSLTRLLTDHFKCPTTVSSQPGIVIKGTGENPVVCQSPDEVLIDVVIHRKTRPSKVLAVHCTILANFPQARLRTQTENAFRFVLGTL